MLTELQNKYKQGKRLQLKLNEVLAFKTELEPDDVTFINKTLQETQEHGILFPDLKKC